MDTRRTGRFNGAAFFQSGKFGSDVFYSRFVIGLQWSRFFSKRKIQPIPLVRRPHHALQWSRFFSKRKMGRRQVPRNGNCSFNGAAFFQSGKFLYSPSMPGQKTGASMEPLFFKAENRVRYVGMSIVRDCFNGAAFFQSGKYLNTPTGLEKVFRASMEPLFFKAENAVLITPSL